MNSDQQQKNNLIGKTENLTHLKGKKGQIIFFFPWLSAAILFYQCQFLSDHVTNSWLRYIDDLEEGKISTICFIPKKSPRMYILFFSVLKHLREKHQRPGLLIAFRQLPKSQTEECSHSCLFFSAGLLKLDFNDTLVSSTRTFPVNIFNLEGGEIMLAQDKGNFHAQCENRTRDPPVQWLERPIFGGSRKVSLSRVSMVSPPFK